MVYALFFIMLVFLALLWVWILSQTAWKKHGSSNEIVVAFFHPSALSGGGGERVLWVMIDALQRRDKAHKDSKTVRYVIYHSAPVPNSFIEASEKIHSQFNIQLQHPVEFVPVMKSHLIDEKRYRRLTMIMQSIGSIRLAWECLTRLCPDYYIDTTGFAFCYPLVRIAGCKIMTYTHYPAVSTDMLSFVRSGTEAHNNSGTIARSVLLTGIKVFYYRIFSYAYCLCGKCAHLVMVNSSWTSSHIMSIWARQDVHIVFPPAPVENLMELPLNSRQNNIVSVAQFRPEKRHDFQIRVFAEVLKNCRQAGIKEEPKLIFVGGCRNEADQQRVMGLKKLTRQLGVENQVTFELNASYEKLKAYLGSSKIGLHVMWNEHFGISVVEYMAAGCIVVAHRSGGPAMDIVTPAHDGPIGFLADSMETYVAALCAILLGDLSKKTLKKYKSAGVSSVKYFLTSLLLKKVQELMAFESQYLNKK